MRVVYWGGLGSGISIGWLCFLVWEIINVQAAWRGVGEAVSLHWRWDLCVCGCCVQQEVSCVYSRLFGFGSDVCEGYWLCARKIRVVTGKLRQRVNMCV